MIPGRHDFRLRQGDTFTATFAFRDRRGTPVDLTGAGLFMQVRDRPGGTLLLDCTPYLAVTDAAAGAARLDVPGTATAAITLPGPCEGDAVRLAYDLEVRDATGGVFTWLAGHVLISPEVTIA